MENELFCLRLAARLKLPVPAVEMRRTGAISFLLVERHDRSLHRDGTITRLHQEDFCQALSVPPELKYEEEGGPGKEKALDLIGRAAARPAADRLGFIRMLIFHYLVGKADAHGKNYALLYRGKISDLAPFYDDVCTAAYPRLAKKLAMTIGGRSIPDTIQLQHWLTLVPNTKGAKRLLIKYLTEFAGRIRDEADALLAAFEEEGIDHGILKTVCGVIDTRATHVLRITEKGLKRWLASCFASAEITKHLQGHTCSQFHPVRRAYPFSHLENFCPGTRAACPPQGGRDARAGSPERSAAMSAPERRSGRDLGGPFARRRPDPLGLSRSLRLDSKPLQLTGSADRRGPFGPCRR